MFEKAVRDNIIIKGGFVGLSGAGKTLSALRMCKGMGGKTAFIDSENKRSKIYANKFHFFAEYLEPPYTVQKYVDAMKNAESMGFDNLIVDSLSHVWAGEGGILDQLNQSNDKNSLQSWGKLTPDQNKLISTLLHLKCHTFVCMRAKEAYSLEKNSQGKMAPKKVGLGAVQRKGVDYELHFSLEIDRETHYAKATKDNTGVFQENEFLITEQIGKELIDWANGVDNTLHKPKDFPSTSILEDFRDQIPNRDYLIPMGAREGQRFYEIPEEDLGMYTVQVSNAMSGKRLSPRQENFLQNLNFYNDMYQDLKNKENPENNNKGKTAKDHTFRIDT